MGTLKKSRNTFLFALVLGAAILFGLTLQAQAACPQYADAAGRNLSERDLAECSCSQLELLRNEIYARHGRIFSRSDLQEFFNNQPWYAPDSNNPNGDKGQNSAEQKNAALILNYEKKKGCR